ELVRQLALAVGVVHAGGLLHRDLKPDNVRLTEDGWPVLIDFGLSLRFNVKETSLPGRGAIAASRLYMSPEQIAPGRAPLSVASDVHALGAILYELLVGQPPFPADNIGELMASILNMVPPPPSKLRPGVPQDLDAICLRALAKKTWDRF